MVGTAHPAAEGMGTECLLGSANQFAHDRPDPLPHLRWRAPLPRPGAPIVMPVQAPDVLPAVAPRTPLPPRDDTR